MTILYLVAHGLMPPGTIYGIFDAEEKAKQAIKLNDPHGSRHCYVEELELNSWIKYGLDV